MEIDRWEIWVQLLGVRKALSVSKKDKFRMFINSTMDKFNPSSEVANHHTLGWEEDKA